MSARGGRDIALVLGSGGARGLAHIGAIEVLEEQGYRIVSIAGASMGALVGAIHAAGKLSEYRDWVCTLQRSDVLRLLDFAFGSGGLIKGERIVGVLRDLVGDRLDRRVADPLHRGRHRSEYAARGLAQSWSGVRCGTRFDRDPDDLHALHHWRARTG